MSNKKLFIPDHNLGFSSIKEVNEIAKPLFERSGISFTDFARIYNNGSWIFLTSNEKLTRFFFDDGFVFLPHVEIKKQKSFLFLSSVNAFERSIKSARENFQVDHILAHINRQPNYVDVFWFGADTAKTQIMDFYLNNVDLLDNYTNYFKLKAHKLISAAEKSKIILPHSLQDEYQEAFARAKIHQDISNHKSYFIEQLQIAGLDVSFTPREIDCIHLLLKGLTAKGIAKRLNLSPRTVESYIENIKTKTQCHSKEQLLDMLAES